MPPDQTAAADKPPDLSDLEADFLRVRESFDDVPSLEQFEALEALAARLEVIVRPASRKGACLDTATGRAVEAELAHRLLTLADPGSWQLDQAQMNQAAIVAAIPEHAGWRTLDTAQRRALTAWHLQHPELTYGNILHLAPPAARRRLALCRGLQARLRGEVAHPPVPSEPAVEAGAGKIKPPPAEQPEPVPPPEPPGTALAGPELTATYIAAGTMGDNLQAELQAAGVKRPDGAAGFIRIDPYGTVNTLNEAVLNYSDKLELPLPNHGITRLAGRIAAYNDLEPAAELPVGRYVWFPDRSVMEAWLRSGDG